MFVAALIVLLIAVLLVLAALFGGGDSATLDLGSFNLETDSRMIFFLGMATLLLFVLAVGMLRSAAKRSSARRADRKKVGELSTKLDAYKRQERGRHHDAGDIREEHSRRESRDTRDTRDESNPRER